MKAELISYMGTDLAVVNAARVSFDKTSEWEEVTKNSQAGDTVDLGETLIDSWMDADFLVRRLSSSDAKLINYLARHDHWTPFAHTSVSLRMSAPVPIRTQCFKHKQGFVENEESRRYISSRPVLFVPEFFRSKPEGSIKQGSAGRHVMSSSWLRIYERQCETMISLYMEMLDDGVCPEQARLVLPQGVEVNWIWTGNLYSYANFYKKRTDSHAQVEVQQLARAVGEIIEPLFPVSWKALTA